METVQLQCGNCNRIMAISTEHLGGQVQCPHCRSVVQTPPRTPPAPPPPVPAPPQRESIFSGPEVSEDLFGAPTQPKVEMPPEPKPAGLMPAPPAGETPAESDADLTKFKRRPLYDASMVPFIAMIFLVPYSILTTLFIIYLLLYPGAGSRSDQFEYLRDPPAKSGGPKRVTMQPKHDLPLPDKLRTVLNKPITIGDLRVTAEKVRLNAGGDLEIFLRAKNVSAKWTFQPISEAFLRFESDKAGNEPYTFLESRSKTPSISNIYGGTQEYRKSFKGKADFVDSIIGPGSEAHIVLTTSDRFRKQLANIKLDEEFLWRLQVRRGMVKVGDKDVSASAVIGVEFSASDIEKAS